MTPVEKIIEVFGGQVEVARILNVSTSAINQWRARGLVPSKHQAILLLEASKREIELKPSDLIGLPQ